MTGSQAEQDEVYALRAAWAGCRLSDLQHPERLAEAIDDLRGDAREPLAELLAALMSSEPRLGEKALDRIVHQHGEAMKVIDRWAKAVVTAEEKRGEWEGFDETR